MDLPNLLPFGVSFLTHAVVCGAWWFVASSRREVALYLWLAVAHSLSLGAQAVTIYYVLTQVHPSSWALLAPLQMALGAAQAALYVVLALRLASQR